MADHFKLEITNRSVRIMKLNNVKEDFATEYSELLSVDKHDKNAEINYDTMNQAMKNIFLNAKQADTETTPSTSSKHKKPAGKYAVYNYAKRMKTRTEKFRTDAYMNFRVPNVQFVTLTFDPSDFDGATDLNICHNAFKKFIQRLHYIFKDFVYIATFSKQKNGNWHYHMLCNLDINVKNKVIQDAWKYGMTHSTPLTSYSEFDSRISYCIDNMYNVAWTDLKGEKGYLSSKGLMKPVVFRSWKDDEYENAYAYLSKILESTDKPLDVSSHDIVDEVTDKTVKISYKVSHKTFPELFDKVKVAKLKK